MNLYNIRCTSQPTHSSSMFGRSASSFLSEGVDRRLFCYTEVPISSIASCSFALLLFLFTPQLSPTPIMLGLIKPPLLDISMLQAKSFQAPAPNLPEKARSVLALGVVAPSSFLVLQYMPGWQPLCLYGRLLILDMRLVPMPAAYWVVFCYCAVKQVLRWFLRSYLYFSISFNCESTFIFSRSFSLLKSSRW